MHCHLALPTTITFHQNRKMLLFKIYLWRRFFLEDDAPSSFNTFRDPPVLTSLSQISCSHSHPQASASRYILYLLQWWYNLGMLHQQNVKEFHLESLFHSIDRAISLSFFSFNSRSPTTFWFYDWFYCLINTFVCVPILRHYEWLNHLSRCYNQLLTQYKILRPVTTPSFFDVTHNRVMWTQQVMALIILVTTNIMGFIVVIMFY